MKKHYSISVKQPIKLKEKDFVLDGWQLLSCKALAELKTIQGTTIQMLYRKIQHSNIIIRVLSYLHWYNEYKDVIYWNPDKNIISNSNKYSDIGPKSRGNHSMIWFEVDNKNKIYKVGMENYVYNAELSIPFPGTHLEKVTSKRLKSILDEILYQNK